MMAEQSGKTNGNGKDSPKHRPPPPPMPSNRKQATPVELAALLMEAVCVPSPSEQEAVEEMAQFLQVPAPGMLSELMFLRAYAIEFGAEMALGDSEEKQAIFERYYRHWDMLAENTDGNLIDDLQERLEYYADAIHSPSSGVAGLTGQIGMAFAARCRTELEGREDLAMLGGSMFAALFDEIAELLQGIDILRYDTD